MDTNVRTPHEIFIMPQRLLVPLFQRPYVWNQEVQWEPLWKDLVRVAERLIADPSGTHSPHFLGAVVLQQVQNPAGDLQQRTIIDGQQRLTTLQILMDAIHAEVHLAGATSSAARLEVIIENSQPFQRTFEDRFKVLPTNRDRDAFNEVMGQEIPLDYSKLQHKDHRLVRAHKYFSHQIREWLQEKGETDVSKRAEVLERSVRELLQIVVIDLTPAENAQEIFETLNARGAVLTAADLIKNFVFQRLLEQESDVEAAYAKYWASLETGFWETTIKTGSLQYQRSSLFINQWLIAKTKEEIVARDVFTRFKTYADFDSNLEMHELLAELHNASAQYRSFIEAGENQESEIDRLGLFSYRLDTMGLDSMRPIVICLLDPSLPVIPKSEQEAVMSILESWLVRRLLVRAQTNAYNKIVPNLIEILSVDRENASRNLERYLASQTADTHYWPDDEEIKTELTALPFYFKIRRARARMIFEAIEDHLRGWHSNKTSFSGTRMRRGTFAIEHVMPQAWTANWPIDDQETSETRDRLIQTIGNLSLLSKRLNSAVSNQAWREKKKSFHEHDLLKLNKMILDSAPEVWTETNIEERTQALIQAIIEIWPVPHGHKSDRRHKKKSDVVAITIGDLVSAGLLHPGQILYPFRELFAGKTATILNDGTIDVDGKIFDTPSGAAMHIKKSSANGWAFWTTDPVTKTRLSQIRTQYIDSLGIDSDDENTEGEETE